MVGSQRLTQQGTKLSNIAIVSIVAAVAATSIYFLADEAIKSDEINLVPTQDVLSGTVDQTASSFEKFWQNPTDIFSAIKAYGETHTKADEEKAAQDVYNDAIIEANLALDKVKSDENATPEKIAEAEQAFTQTLLDAKAEYEKTLDKIEEKYTITFSTVEEAMKFFLQTLQDAKAEYEQAITDATTKEEKSIAAEVYNQTILDAKDALEKAKAELGG